MLRVKEVLIRTRYEETDRMGVIYYSNYLKYFEDGRNLFFRSLGYSYKRMEEEGVMCPVTKCDIVYHSPAFYDDELIIRTQVDQLRGVRFVLSYSIARVDEGKETLLVTGSTTHAFLNMNLMPVRVKKDKPELWFAFESCL